MCVRVGTCTACASVGVRGARGAAGGHPAPTMAQLAEGGRAVSAWRARDIGRIS